MRIELKHQINALIINQLWERLDNKLYRDLCCRFSDQLRDQLWNQLNDQLRDQLRCSQR